jgi:glycosyltransferase involved in cell wall biosynthesis
MIMPAIRRNPLQLLAVPALLWAEYRAIGRLVRADPPSIIYAHWFTPQAVTAWPAARRARLPLVFTTHASDVAVWARFGRVGRSVVRSVTCAAGRFTAVSQATLDRMRPFFDDAQWDEVRRRAAIVPMGVDVPPARSRATMTNSYPGMAVVLFMGRLVEKKGADLLIKAFSMVHRQMPETMLVIAGEGPLRQHLESCARELQIASAVDFAGFVSGSAKLALFERADVCVLPSAPAADGDAEGLPVALLEALVHGKPTIATDATNAAEIVTHGRDGLICQARDAQALGDALAEVLSWSPEHRAHVSAAARATGAHFEWPAIAERTASFLLDPYVRSDP